MEQVTTRLRRLTEAVELLMDTYEQTPEDGDALDTLWLNLDQECADSRALVDAMKQAIAPDRMAVSEPVVLAEFARWHLNERAPISPSLAFVAGWYQAIRFVQGQVDLMTGAKQPQ